MFILNSLILGIGIAGIYGLVVMIKSLSICSLKLLLPSVNKKLTVANVAKVGAVKLVSPLNPNRFRCVFSNLSWRLVAVSLMRRGRKVHTRIRVFSKFSLLMLSITRRHGVAYLIKYLKACQLAIQKAVAGQPLKSLRELEPTLPVHKLTSTGLPTWIGTRDRRAILGGSVPVIRLYLTLFSVYRIIPGPLSPKLNTITDHYSGNLESLREACQLLSQMTSVLKEFTKISKFKPPTNGLLWITKAAPTKKVSFIGALPALHILANTRPTEPFVKYGMSQLAIFIKFLLATNQDNLMKDLQVMMRHLLSHPKAREPMEGISGKLSFKAEPAGKLRIFAIVDV